MRITKKWCRFGLGMVLVIVQGVEASELISGDALSHFRTSEMWTVGNGVEVVEGEKRFVETRESVDDKVLYNGLVKQKTPYLFTEDEFKDVEVTLEFMVPKESNAGIYFMGRYEVQILDSFGKESVKFSDLGGIYQRWRSNSEAKELGLEKGERGYEGVAPRLNAAKAPGEWQEMNIVFRAPRFDYSGKKIENARFVSVHVNGQLVQKNIEVTGPTRAAPLKGEVSRGPIAIQGDHGPVAIRRYEVNTIDLDKEEPLVFEANWESLSAHTQAPEWFSDAKLGIYFHWGVYSVPAFGNEWYPSHMYGPDNEMKSHHIETYGDPSEFNYHDFIPMFTGEMFDAEEWAQLFKDAGARFAGPCAQHHDGFAMWDSEVNPWNAADRGPKKDITGLLEDSLTSKGLKVITTFHHAKNLQRHGGDPEKWHNFSSHYTYNPDYATSSTDPELAKFYGNIPEDEFNEYWFAQLKEVIDQYSPDIIWFDTWLNYIPEELRQEFVAYYLNEAKKKNKEVVIAYKQNDIPASIGVLDIEQGGKKDISESVWLTDVTLSMKSWSYIKGQKYKSADLVVRNMIDVWSKNGVVLLNISPMANGVINQTQREVLGDIGTWMKKHAEAVYETRPFEVNGFGQAKAKDGKYGGQSATVEYSATDGRFLKSKDGKFLYLFFLGKPEVGAEVEIKQLAKFSHFPAEGVKRITLVGSGEEVSWHHGFKYFYLTIPDAEMDEIATVFKIELN